MLPLKLESMAEKRQFHGDAESWSCEPRSCPVMGRRPTNKSVSGSPPWSVRQTSSNQGGLQRRTNRDQRRVTWNPRASQPGFNGEPTGVQRRVQGRVSRGSTASRQGFEGKQTGVQRRANRGSRASQHRPKGKEMGASGEVRENHRPHAPWCFSGIDSAALVALLADRCLGLGHFACHCLHSLPLLLIPCTKRSRSLTHHQIAKPSWS